MIEPADVVTAVADGVCQLARGTLTPADREALIDAMAALYAEQTDVRHPFAPLGDTPLRTRAEVREHFSRIDGEGVERYDVVDARVHRTDDPEVVIFEFTYAGSLRGRDFAVPCIFVMRVRDGVIVESRDYADHIGMARAFDRLPALASALAG
ncbi:nuclear transport factor 2 family protein [Actinoplanes sp. N902-109]|uniref:nuclear transport factor 2 family protein n=1 Tax=Actinoplanes sp. (strain N902-109) TaxID=649831 RepID=UPI000329405F|nr:nuclear transport factor 2 family protein [Actinoplanes sp. N902-109]AGL15918.1 hypothetical protein L083_2408 [Actinoplanes sp. N902-109]